MIVVGVSYLSSVSKVATTAQSGAAKVGTAIGATLAIGIMVAAWFVPVVGALLVGLLVKKSNLVETGPTGSLASLRSGDMPPPRTMLAKVGIAVFLVLFLGLSVRAYVNRDSSKPRAVDGAGAPFASPVAKPANSASTATGDRTGANRLSIASFKGELLAECDDIEIAGKFEVPGGKTIDREKFLANLLSVTAVGKKKAPIRLKAPCDEQFPDQTPLATCTFDKVQAAASMRGRLAFYSTNAVVADSLIKECESGFQGTWHVLAKGSEEYRRAASREATPESPAVISDGQDTVQFGKPTVKETGFGMTKVMVQVKNVTDRKITCVVEATFMKQDTILGTAQGTVNAISVGSAKTAELMTQDKIRGFDIMKLDTGACF
jgi:hypothetical protein